MRIPRPYIPLSVRAKVATHQAYKNGMRFQDGFTALPFSVQIRRSVEFLFGDQRAHLDHDPALENRVKVFNKIGDIIGYVPDANDPEYLIYRTADDHRIKTLVRGDGAQRSDASQRRYLKRVAKNRQPKSKSRFATRKIAQPKNFKWPKRKLRNMERTNASSPRRVFPKQDPT